MDKYACQEKKQQWDRIEVYMYTQDIVQEENQHHVDEEILYSKHIIIWWPEVKSTAGS